MQKVRSHVKAVQDIRRILPLTFVTVEVAQFDTQLLKNPDIAGKQYQRGPRLGFWNTREYVLFRDNHKCQHCHGKSNDPVLNVHHLESRKTGGDSPDNLITLCETCHKAYHRGELELKIRRNSKSLRDAAFMSIMRWKVYNGLKQTLNIPIRLTYGYLTKRSRIEHGLNKSHAVDARCISGNPTATPNGELLRFRQLRRHNRKVSKSNPLKGGRWKHNQAPREIKGFRLFDIVLYNSIPAYVHGRRSSGHFVVKDFEGNILSNSVSCKSLELIRHNNNQMFHFIKRIGSIPPTKFAGFLEHFS
jgi:N6-L-threonylcarbamoyladenine synthase